ncbi:SDR family NAD(P)-dependent oxidoreductase [Streptomyces turgidiscabies]|uniref:Acyl transferase domain-containing protein/NAD(P)H-dependent flavin oxidoreductase YrpB (Nitropropane dioxygenase family) n=1 Tax=Streptomyces turgidiscabies TaxID=85558 RepID=A0ABU0RKX5_9ACTN|nr:SDR family NAD(P)-dependent oxidoreductase [Streptomyces turgidiscabies]MDQ0932635.1 acyl transferase domain-containing protein/NAD(P)H-dependent flavin oxidoreductase YrpB (nitropropane dioxygenase family) [Streptomyces turgidiscabies]
MTSVVRAVDMIVGVTPFGEPDARLAAAVSRAGGLGVLDLGLGDRRARDALARMRRLAAQAPASATAPGFRYGVRIGPHCRLTPADLGGDGGPGTVILAPDAADAFLPVDEIAARHRVLVEVTDLADALAAVHAGAHGLIARGSDGGGRIGELSTFVLLQRLLAEPGIDLPVWARGGIGPCTAAAAVAGGAAGVVLDSQLALLAESSLPEATAAALRSMDGSETVVVAGHRVLHRRGPDAPPVPAGDPAAVAALLGAQDPRTQLLPVGQDGFLAARFAARWGDTARTVRALTDAVREVVGDVVRGAGAVRALRAGSPMSRALGTQLPIAQGPMTRVSDQARFAAAVAGGGALPFVALALATGEQTRTMLAETREAVGDDRPWGVGVLGFAPEELRNAQLEAVRELRPTHAIIAGGRPAQAEALERAGISTFLHVPSPGLLKQFLEAGARRFVFEGSECGGHVGPRGSFPLWEAQLAVIEDYLEGTSGASASESERIEVFFAGGVHDERSAAMVAALAAPLTARGASVGVLMGTAYLFTEEAVACGAVQPLFQRQVVDATSTALLETAPGHATRCVPSPFSDNYRDIEAELRASGVPERRIWEELERLNVGRLRIASKGIERDAAGELAAVDEQRQLAEGMFMAGEVAVLRSAVTTVDALHHSVADGAADFLTGRAAQLREPLGVRPPEEAPAPAPLDVAVVGMACMFPDAPDLAAFWANVLGGHDAVAEVPADRWDPAVHYSAEDGDGGVTPSKWGGFLPRIPFDPLSYGIPPTSLGSIEPVQLLALEAARRALTHAGYGERGREFDRSRTSVVFGAEAGSDLSNAGTLRAVLPSYYGKVPDGLADQLPRLTEDSFPGMLSNVISGRIANRLDLGGANYTVDAACASSLAAVDVACKELVGGTSDVVLCGGADLHNGINDYVLFSSVHALSPTGRSRAFDSSADGIALGEGVACVVLKRLADAERDGDRIYGVIKGVGSSSDGRSLGLTAPRPEGQRAALQRAYRNAGVSPAEVGLVEAHGTGTVVGDRTELTILGEVFSDAGAKPGGVALGSVKSQIGHTKCAAGLAGLIKTVLALHTGVKPPTLHVSEPNSAWETGSSPFVFHGQARPWATPAHERVAGVSAFGFGGTNFHVVLEAYADSAPPAHTLDAWPAELFTFRAADPAGARRAVEDVLKAAQDEQASWRLRDLALAASRRSDARHEPVQIAVVATDPTELAGQLRRALAGEHDPRAGVHLARNQEETPGQVAFLFPGQGSQRTGMFADVFVALPELQYYLELGRDHADVLYPPTPFDHTTRDRQHAALTDTRVAQPALGIAGLAAHALLTTAGVRPDMAAGHSYGELVALSAAGALDPETLLALSAQRATAILSAAGDAGDDPGTMAAVSAGAEDVTAALRTAEAPASVVVANHNSPKQTVISGPTEAVGEAVRLLRAAGLGAKRIPVACAFHSPLVAGAGARFAAALAQQPVRAPEFTVWSNRTAAPYGADADAVRAELAAQIGAPVAFAAQIEAMYEAGARIFVEAGPGSVLTRLVGQILGDRPHRTVACEPGPDSGLRGWLDALAQLAVAGLPVRTGWLFHGRDAVDATRTKAPKRPGWTVDGHLVRTAAGELLPGALAPARRVVETTTVTANHQDGTPGADGRDALISEFLRTSREMVAAQRDVLLTYFGAAPGQWIPAPAAPEPVGAAQPQVQQAAQLPAPTYPPALYAVPAPVPAPAAAVGFTEADVLGVVLEIISERTGYPVDMIEPDLDLEADLSIDSIKRAEIAGELAQRLGVGGGGDLTVLADAELEELAKARTAASVTAWLAARLATAVPVPALAAAPASAAVGFTEADVLGVVLEIISERTGYPVDMIEPDLDLEADLSIDSIKRAEIAGELAQRLGVGGGGDLTVLADAELEELAKARTAASVTAWLAARFAGPAEAEEPAAPPQSPRPAAAGEPDAPPEVTGEAPKRFQLRPVLLEQQDGNVTATGTGDPAAVLAGKRFVVLGDDDAGEAAREVVARLTGHGADAVVLGPERLLTVADGPVDGVLYLDPLASSRPPVLPDAFPVLKAALGLGPRWLFAVRVAAEGGADGAELRTAGLHGLFRTVAREYPETDARIIDLAAPDTGAAAVADALLGELLAPDRTPVVLRTAAGRHGLELVETPLGALGTTGAGPAGDGAAEAAALGLDRDSVVLLVGGARGITAKFAAALASASRCRIELLGRTPAPDGPEDAATAAARTRTELRAALAARGGLTPAAISREAELLLAQREITATLHELEALGSPARYHSVDFRAQDAALQAVKEIHAEHGRLDGVVYAAGVIEDRLIAEKTTESFQRVYGTKTTGAETLLAALEQLPNSPAFAVLFGSISAVLGNRGQVDYAAANDALQSLGAAWAARSGQRALTVHWGPWAPTGGHTGMVTPELGREYARRGVRLIDPEEGTAALLRELAWGEESAGAVVYTSSGW